MSHHKKHPNAMPDGEASGPGQPLGEQTASSPVGDAKAPVAMDELAQVKAQRDDYLSRLQRLSADYANYQKRAQRELVESREYCAADLIKSLLPVLDDMERAIAAAAKSAAKDDPVLAGMQLLHDKALDILRRHGLEPIAAAGEPFDPARHHAISMIPSDHEPHTVIQELQKGYTMKGRILRPSSVVVSTGPSIPDATEPKQ